MVYRVFITKEVTLDADSIGMEGYSAAGMAWSAYDRCRIESNDAAWICMGVL